MCGLATIGLSTAVPLFLLSLLGSYVVLTLSKSQPYPLGMLGRIIGILVMMISIGSLICSAVCRFWR